MAPVIVRPYESGGNIALIEHALSQTPGMQSTDSAYTYVAVGDQIEVDEQVRMPFISSASARLPAAYYMHAGETELLVGAKEKGPSLPWLQPPICLAIRVPRRMGFSGGMAPMWWTAGWWQRSAASSNASTSSST